MVQWWCNVPVAKEVGWKEYVGSAKNAVAGAEAKLPTRKIDVQYIANPESAKREVRFK